jgi:hypothetical protein
MLKPKMFNNRYFLLCAWHSAAFWPAQITAPRVQLQYELQSTWKEAAVA